MNRTGFADPSASGCLQGARRPGEQFCQGGGRELLTRIRGLPSEWVGTV